MIHSLLVENFRCYQRLSIHDLKRINVVVGGGSNGKTALLEAIYLAASNNPNVALKFRHWRGLGRTLSVQGSAQSFEGAFADLFARNDTSASIAIQLAGPITRSVKVAFGSQASLDVGDTSEVSMPIRPLTFTWADPGNEPATGEIKIGGGQLSITSSNIQAVLAAFLNSTSLADMGAEGADRLSQLSIHNQEREVLEPLQTVFDRVVSLSTEIVGGNPTICVGLKDLPFKQPVGLFSAGALKLVQHVGDLRVDQEWRDAY
jgi:hypothetical protein